MQPATTPPGTASPPLRQEEFLPADSHLTKVLDDLAVRAGSSLEEFLKDLAVRAGTVGRGSAEAFDLRMAHFFPFLGWGTSLQGLLEKQPGVQLLLLDIDDGQDLHETSYGKAVFCPDQILLGTVGKNSCTLIREPQGDRIVLGATTEEDSEGEQVFLFNGEFESFEDLQTRVEVRSTGQLIGLGLSTEVGILFERQDAQGNRRGLVLVNGDVAEQFLAPCTSSPANQSSSQAIA